MRATGAVPGTQRRVRFGPAGRFGLLGAVTIALLVIGSSWASASTVLPRYKGATQSFQFANIGGCGTGKLVKLAKFYLGTGKGSGGSETDRSRACRTFAGPLGGYATNEASVEALLDLKIAAGITNVTPTIGANWSVSGTFSVNGTCPSAPYSDQYSNGSTPGSTFAYWVNVSAMEGSCEAYADSFASAYVNLVDITNGTYMQVRSPTGCTYNYGDECYVQLASYSVVTLTEIEYNYVYHYTQYYHGKWSYSNYTCANCNHTNSSLTSTYAATGASSAMPSFVGPFVPSHVYALEVWWYTSTDADLTGWAHGTVSATTNLGTSGNGVFIPSVSET